MYLVALAQYFLGTFALKEGGRVVVDHLDLSGTLNGVDPRTGYLRLDRTMQHTGEELLARVVQLVM